MKPTQSGIHGVLGVMLLAGAASATISCGGGGELPVRRYYKQVDLASDIVGRAAYTDSKLVNPWGIAYGPETPFWIANNGTGTSTVYLGTGQPAPTTSPLVVSIPRAQGQPSGTVASPTGVVYNGTERFPVGASGLLAPARFIFVTEDGTVSAWSPEVDPTNAIKVADHSVYDAVYKGVAIAEVGGDVRLYVTDFRGNRIDAYNWRFDDLPLDPGDFYDPGIPPGYAPFSITRIEDTLYVTYALQDADMEDDVPGAGHGYVDAYSMEGILLRRVASGGVLNSPWGVTVAPEGFGALSGTLLIGNFGDGQIHAFDRETYAYRGALTGAMGLPIAIKGLWGITAGNGGSAGDRDKLYLTAGIDDEAHGLFARLEYVEE